MTGIPHLASRTGLHSPRGRGHSEGTTHPSDSRSGTPSITRHSNERRSITQAKNAAVRAGLKSLDGVDRSKTPNRRSLRKFYQGGGEPQVGPGMNAECEKGFCQSEPIHPRHERRTAFFVCTDGFVWLRSTRFGGNRTHPFVPSCRSMVPVRRDAHVAVAFAVRSLAVAARINRKSTIGNPCGLLAHARGFVQSTIANRQSVLSARWHSRF